MPARLAPRMSVSSRSPRKSGCRAPNRATASSKIGTSGLPATVASRPTAVCTAETSVPLPGAMPRACGIVQSVLVAIHGMPPSSSGSGERVRGLGQLRPADLGGEPLHDGGRRVVGAARDDEAGLLELAARARRRRRRAPSRPAATRSASRRIAACGLVTTSAGAVVEAEFAQVRGDGCVGARGVVGDVAEPAAVAAAVEALDRVRERAGAGVDDPVEVGEHDVDAVERGRRRDAPSADSNSAISVLATALGRRRPPRRSATRLDGSPRSSARRVDSPRRTPRPRAISSSSRAVRVRRARLLGDLGAALPLLGLVVAAELLEHGRARGEQRGAPLERPIGVELGDVQLLQRALGLAEVEPGARHGDREFDANRRRQRAAGRPRGRPRARGRGGRRRARCRP